MAPKKDYSKKSLRELQKPCGKDGVPSTKKQANGERGNKNKAELAADFEKWDAEQARIEAERAAAAAREIRKAPTGNTRFLQDASSSQL